MMHNITPLYLSSLVPQSIGNLSRYNLRNSKDLQTIDARTNNILFLFCHRVLEHGITYPIMQSNVNL